MSRRKTNLTLTHDEIMQNRPTRSKQKAIHDGRPLIPRCRHQGCTRDAAVTRGVGRRMIYLCKEHQNHKDYKRLSFSGYRPLITFGTKK